MDRHDYQEEQAPLAPREPSTPARRDFLKIAAAAGTGLALTGAAAGTGLALTGAAPSPPSQISAAALAAGCNESVQEIVNTLLTVEHLAMTFYYTGVTTKTVVGNSTVPGSTANPHASPHHGQARNVASLYAALDQELKHGQFLADFGAISPYKKFYFPATTFKTLGYTTDFGVFLWVLDHLETAMIGAYLAAVKRLGTLSHVDLAVLSARILAVECEHRALGRVVAGDYPSNNVTIEVNSFGCVGDALTFIKPFLTGKGFKGGATGAMAIPSQRDVVQVVGPYAT